MRIGGLLGGSDVDRDRSISCVWFGRIRRWHRWEDSDQRADGVTPGSPMLQVGGVQEAVRIAPPALARTLALLAPWYWLWCRRARPRDCSCSSKRRMGNGNSRVFIKRIDGVAVIETLPPLLTVIEFPAWPVPRSAVDGLDEARRVWDGMLLVPMR